MQYAPRGSGDLFQCTWWTELILASCAGIRRFAFRRGGQARVPAPHLLAMSLDSPEGHGQDAHATIIPDRNTA